MKETNWKSKGESIVHRFLESKKNSNSLLELEDLLLSSEEECVVATVPLVYDLFSKIYPTRMLHEAENEEYKTWLLSRYQDFTSHILNYLSNSTITIRMQALETLLQFVKLEGFQKENAKFPFSLFKSIIYGLVLSPFKQQAVIKVFRELVADCSDVQLYALKSLQELLSESHEISEVFIENCLMLLCLLKFPKSFGDSEKVFINPPDSPQLFHVKEKVLRKYFTSVWNRFLSCRLPPSVLRRLLPFFCSEVLPHLQNPCLMTDFLTNAYNKGGILSLLALKGLYFLMDKYNLEYPDFYVQLYALLDAELVNGRHSNAFFHLAQLFLSSTHLPSHSVAAFAKRLSRLALVSSTSNALRILGLISHLLSEHISLRALLHSPDSDRGGEDPFLEEERDPAKSNAIHSSLCELQALHWHVHPEVCCRATELLNGHTTTITQHHNLYSRVRKRKFSEVPLSVQKPKYSRSQ